MNRTKRYGALLLALTMAFSMALSASAAPSKDTSTGLMPIPDSGDSMITIHKYIIPDDYEDDFLLPGGGKELQGSETVYKNGDTTRNWNDVKAEFTEHAKVPFIIKKVGQTTAWTPPPIINGTTATTFADGGYRGETDDNGLLKIEGLAYGDYQLLELSSDGYSPIYENPIEVSVPTQLLKAGTSGNVIDEWIYNIHVYPKNQKQGNVKKILLPPEDPDVDDGTVGAVVGRGTEYTFEIAIELPRKKFMDAYKADPPDPFYIKVVDPLDGRLNYQESEVHYAPSENGTREKITSGFYLDPPVRTGNDNILTILFSNHDDHTPTDQNGIEYLAGKMENDETPYLYIIVKATMDPRESSSSVTVGNPGKKNPDDPADPDRNVVITWPDNPGSNIPSDETNRSGVCDIKIEKRDAANTDTKLSGAKFMLFRTEKAAKDYDPDSDDADWLAARAVRNPAVASGSAKELYTFGGTNDSGLLYIREINAWDETTEGSSTTTNYYHYWLVEVEAPKLADGTSYNLLTAPWEIEFVAENKGTKELTVHIDNNKGFILPRTGGSGTLLFTIVGLSLITIAGVTLIVYRRRRKHNDAA